MLGGRGAVDARDGRIVSVDRTAARALAEVLGAAGEGDAAVGAIDGGPASAGFRVEGATGSDEGGHIGDGVAQPDASSRPGLQVDRLVEVEGVGRVPVQHSSILGFITPVAAPLFAWVLLGEQVTLGTAVGGALILAAGALVALWGRPDAGAEPAL